MKTEKVLANRFCFVLRKKPRPFVKTRCFLYPFLLFLAACSSPTDTLPAAVSITSPASGSPVSGTTTVQLSATDDVAVTSVKLYVRGKGSSARGVLVGTATQEPYVVSWYTLAQPNLSDLELVAVATDTGGNEGESAPVSVRVQNSNVPTLNLLTAYNLPSDPSLATMAAASQSLNVNTPTLGALPPTTSLSSLTPQSLTPLAEEGRSYVLEWQWSPFVGSADGYGVYLSEEDLAGPYDLMVRQAASSGSGVQAYSKVIPEAALGVKYHGVVSAVTGGATAEGGFSNADGASLLPTQSAVSPQDGQTVSGGRPAFTWQATPGAVGYLYYVYDKNPFEPNATLLYSNFPNSSAALAATYPAEQPALSSGTYYWWVAGVSFDTAGKADSFTFSEPRTLVVP